MKLPFTHGFYPVKVRGTCSEHGDCQMFAKFIAMDVEMRGVCFGLICTSCCVYYGSEATFVETYVTISEYARLMFFEDQFRDN